MKIHLWFPIAMWILFPTAGHAGADPDLSPKDIVEPAEGIEKVEPMAPDWCQGDVQPENPKRSSPIYNLRSRVSRGYPLETLRRIAQAACAKPNDPLRQKWIANLRQGFINQTGMTEAQDRAAMKLWMLTQKQYEAQLKETCEQIAVEDDMPADEKAFATVYRNILGCGRPNRPPNLGEFSWWYDRTEAAPTELLKAYFVATCFDPQRISSKPEYSASLLTYCGPDARRLDITRLESDVQKLKLGEIGRVHGTWLLQMAKHRYDQFSAFFLKKAKRNPAYRELLFDTPEAGYKAWVRAVAANKAAVDAARQIEKHYLLGSRKALAGCYPKLFSHFKSYVESRGVKKREDIKSIGRDSVAYLLLSSLTVCASFEERFHETRVWYELVQPNPVSRGPRTAAYYAAVDRLSEILADQKSFPIQANRFSVSLPDDPSYRGRGWLTEAQEKTFNKLSFDSTKAQIKSIKRKPKGLWVTFRTVTWMEPIYKCKETNRIDRITADGKIIYRKFCTPVGRKKRKSTAKPVLIPKELSARIAKGRFVKLSVDRLKKTAVPVAVYKTKKQKRLIAAYGIKVK